MTNLTVKTVEYVDDDASMHDLAENATLTIPLPSREIAEAISNVVARSDDVYALDLITMLQVKARIAVDTGERLSLDAFAELAGWSDELAQLRAE